MGLGIYIGAPLKSTGLFRKQVKPSKLLKRIEKSSLDFLKKHNLDWLTKTSISEEVLSIFIHAAEEPVEFSFSGDFLVCSAKTNGAGPGYHRFVVSLIEDIEAKCNLEWNWYDETQDFMDETGYQDHRNFDKLQNEMHDWLTALLKHLLGSKEFRNISLSLPLGFSVVGNYFAISPLGFWDETWAKNVSQSTGDSFLGRDFFPWWNQEIDGEFWKNLGLVKVWTEIKWQQPESEQDRHMIKTTLKCFKRAKELNPEINLPTDEISDLECLLRNEKVQDPGEIKDRMGFLRWPMRRQMTGEWTIVLPGYFYQDYEDDGSTVVYWWNGRTVRCSSFSFEGPKQYHLSKPKKKESNDTFEYNNNQQRGYAVITKQSENGEHYWLLSGDMGVPNSSCVVSIYFDNISDKEWALETWRSLFNAKGDGV